MLSESYLAEPNECVLNAWYARATFVLRACYANDISATFECMPCIFLTHPILNVLYKCLILHDLPMAGAFCVEMGDARFKKDRVFPLGIP